MHFNAIEGLDIFKGVRYDSRRSHYPYPEQDRRTCRDLDRFDAESAEPDANGFPGMIASSAVIRLRDGTGRATMAINIQIRSLKAFAS